MTTVLLGVGSPIIAGIAVVVAIWHVRTHAAISTRSNSLPVASAAFDEFRSKEFQDHLQTLWNRRPTSVPKGGFASLPDDWRDSAYRVVYFFEYLGVLVAYDLVPKDLVVDFSANLLLRSWCVLEPFIEAERRYRRASCQPANISPGFVTHFEHLVALAHDADGRPTDSKIHKRLRLRKVTAAARSGVDPATFLSQLPGQPGQPQTGVGPSIGDGRGSAAPPVGEVAQPTEGGTRDGAAVYGGT